MLRFSSQILSILFFMSILGLSMASDAQTVAPSVKDKKVTKNKTFLLSTAEVPAAQHALSPVTTKLLSLVDSSPIYCTEDVGYRLVVQGSKLQLKCGEPTIANDGGSSTTKGSWTQSTYDTRSICLYGCKDISLQQGTRTKCRYRRKITNHPSGTTSWELSSFHTFTVAKGGRQFLYINSSAAAAAGCPIPSTFGLSED